MRFRSNRWRILLAASLGFVLVSAAPAMAQLGGTGGGTGAGGFGGGTTGIGGFGGTGGTLGGTGMGGTTGMGGATGGAGASSGSLTTSTTLSLSQPTSPFGTTAVTGPFQGFNRASSAFAHSALKSGTNGATGAGGMGTNAMSGLGGLGGLGRGGLGGLGGLNNRNRMGGFGQNSNSQNQSTVRATMTLGFEPTTIASGEVATAVKTRISRMSLPDRMKQINIDVQGRTATLRGTVQTESDKRMMARLISLEPGISEIKNEIVVSSNR